ncbi:tRNA lysidine(34) synthetase TilS [Streptococcus cameli]
MKQKFLKVARDGHFFDKHQKVLVAVSTGQDSMALLECLLACQEELSIKIGIAHVNHKQRPESDAEEHFLQEFAEQKQIPFFTTSYSLAVFSEKKARDVRYDFFTSIMESERYTALVTAHHADDQAETILMRIIRGNRLTDLRGIKAVRQFGPGELIRPLLSFKKEELKASRFFEDTSNNSSFYFRNRIRNHYLPLLEEENPQIRKQLLSLGEEIHSLKTALKSFTQAIDCTNIQQFQAQPKEVQYFLLQQYLESFSDLQLSKDQLQQVLTILRKKANYQGYLKNDYFLSKNYQRFSIEKISPQTDVEKEEYVLQSDEILEFGNAIFSLNTEIPHDYKIYCKKRVPIILRYRKPGDKILLNGINKKLRRFFIDEKIPADMRQKAILIEQDFKILGITNIVTSDLSKSLKNDIMSDILYIKMKE